jgi:hypothetical protein
MMLGTALALFGAAGCRPADNAQVQQQVQGARQELNRAADQARKTAADASLAGNVKAALQARKGLDARNIDVDAKGSTVTLKGDVDAPEQATMAEQVATETKGVGQVVNQLTMRIPAKSAAPANPAPGAADTNGAGAAPSSGGSAHLDTPQPTVTH